MRECDANCEGGSYLFQYQEGGMSGFMVRIARGRLLQWRGAQVCVNTARYCILGRYILII